MKQRATAFPKLPVFIAAGLLSLTVIWFVSASRPYSQTINLNKHPEILAYIDEVSTKYHFDKKALQALFQKVRFQPTVIASIQKPYERKTWDVYHSLFVTKKRISKGVAFWQAHNKVLNIVSKHYGVPPEIIVAILGVETRYGDYPLPYRAMDALTTLAFNYPKRADFFKSELTELLLLSREQHMDPLAFRSSYAGALGTPQFMPSSYRKYAVGFHKASQADLVHNIDDSIISIANYLVKFGWKTGGKIAVLPTTTSAPSRLVKHLTLRKSHHASEEWLVYPDFYVLMHYNTSPQYAMAVYQLAQKLKANLPAHATASTPAKKTRYGYRSKTTNRYSMATKQPT